MFTSLSRAHYFCLVCLQHSLWGGKEIGNCHGVFCGCNYITVCVVLITAFEIINSFSYSVQNTFPAPATQKNWQQLSGSLLYFSIYSSSYLTMGKCVVCEHCCGLMKAFCKALSISWNVFKLMD